MAEPPHFSLVRLYRVNARQPRTNRQKANRRRTIARRWLREHKLSIEAPTGTCAGCGAPKGTDHSNGCWKRYYCKECDVDFQDKEHVGATIPHENTVHKKRCCRAPKCPHCDVWLDDPEGVKHGWRCQTRPQCPSCRVYLDSEDYDRGPPNHLYRCHIAYEHCGECDARLSGKDPDKHKEKCSHAPKCDICGLWLENDEADFEYSIKFPCGHKEDCPNRPKCEICGAPLGGALVNHRTSCPWNSYGFSSGTRFLPTLAMTHISLNYS